MRKVLSFVLVLSLVLGSFGMAFAATPALSDVAGQDCEDAVNVLTQLGVVEGYPDGSYKPDKVVTRAEMAVIVISALGLEDYAVGTAKFSDMAGHWSNGYVAYATSLGIIAGYPDGTFKPDKTVSYDEAATMLVAALGYTPDSLVGTWPANFVSKAKTLGILEGIKAGTAGAVRGDIAIMTYQTLDQNIGKTDKDGVWTATVLKEGNPPLVPAVYDDMMSRLGAELYTPATLATGDAFVLTEAIADLAIADVREYVGAYVTAYANDKNEIIAIKEVKSTFLTGTFDAASFSAAPEVLQTGGVFTNDANDVEYDLRTVAPIAPIVTEYFLNGADSTVAATIQTYPAGDGSKDATYTIAAKISGTKIDAIYSVAEWNLSAAFTFEEDMLEDDNLNGYDFTLDDNDKIDLDSFVLLGADSLDAIAEDDVVYVYTAGGFITKIEVGTKTVSGEVTKVNAAGDKFTIDGKTYSEGVGYIGTDPSAGDKVKLILDYAGDVYDVDSITSADTYAMVVAVNDGATGAFGKEPKIQLVLADGTNKVFKADAKAIDDGTGVIINETTYKWKTGTAGDPVNEGALIKYGLNANGEINAITPLVEVDGTVGSKLTANGYYNGLKVKSDATILVYDGTAAFNFLGAASYFAATIDADDFSMTTLDKILDTSGLVAYYHVNSGGQIDFMVIDSAAVVSDDVYGVAVANGTNNSDAGFYVDVLINGVKESYNAKAAYADRTQVHKVTFDTNGNVTLTPVAIGTNATKGTAVPTATSFRLSINSNNVVAKDTTTITGAGTFDVNTAPFTLASDVVVYVKDGSKYTIGKFSDLKTDLTAAEFFDLGANADRDGVVDLVLITKK